jgi:hypothetical protein
MDYLRGFGQSLAMIDDDSPLHLLRRVISAIEAVLDVVGAMEDVGRALRIVVRELRVLEGYLPGILARLSYIRRRHRLRPSMRFGPLLDDI